METLIAQYGWVIGVTKIIVDLIKPIIPEQAKKYLPLLSIVIAWVSNILMKWWQGDMINDMIEWILLWLSTSKTHDILKSNQKDFTTNTVPNEIWYIVEDK